MSPKAACRAGFSLPGLLMALAVVTILAGVGWFALPRFSWSTEDGEGPMMQVVERKEFIHDITERGNVESASNVEIVSKVRSNNSSGTTILEIVSEGYKISQKDIENTKILEELSFPDAMIERGQQRWYTLEVPNVEVPKEFAVAFSFDPQSSTGIRLGTEPKKETESNADGPDQEQQEVLDGSDLMVRIFFGSDDEFLPTAAEEPDSAGGDSAEKDSTKVVVEPTSFSSTSAGEFQTPKGVLKLTYVNRSAEKSSISASGKALLFKRPDRVDSVVKIEIFARRYGQAESPQDRFKVYLLAKEPKVLVQLDYSSLDNQRLQQQIVYESSKAAVIQVRNVLETAQISKKEYLDGMLKQEKLGMKIAIEQAKIDLSRSEQLLEFNERLYRKGYVTPVQLEEYKIQVTKDQNQLELAEDKLDVLLKYTADKNTKELVAAIKTAEAKLKAELASHLLDKEKLDLVEEQIANCTIYATDPGQVVYANTPGHRGRGEVVIEEGTVIREHQAIIRLPDPTRMQVKAQINEANISLVEVGMSAKIRLDAFPDLELKGIVEQVSEYPTPAGWFGPSVKEYETLVRILDPPDEIRPGYNAEVKIRVEHTSSVLQVPVQAIIEHGNKLYCVFRDGKGFKEREVKMAATNDKVVVIESGLEEGEQVVLNAAAMREELDLPEVAPEAQVAQDGDTPDGAKPGGAKPPGPRPGLAADATEKPGPEKPRKGPPSVGQVMSRVDSNGNGQIDKDELDKMSAPMRNGFAAADANQDGAIDRKELTSAMAKLRQQNRGGGPQQGAGT